MGIQEPLSWNMFLGCNPDSAVQYPRGRWFSHGTPPQPFAEVPGVSLEGLIWFELELDQRDGVMETMGTDSER